MWGYRRYLFNQSMIESKVTDLLLHHEKLSGVEIFEHLQNVGMLCKPTTVYKLLVKLRSKRVIIEVGRERKYRPEKKRASNLIYYSLNYANADLYKEGLLEEIKAIFAKVGINVENDFFKLIETQKLHSIQVFLEQLRCYIIYDEHEDSSCDIWGIWGRSLTNTGFPTPISNFLSIESKKDREKALREIVRRYKISPAILALLLPIQTKKPFNSKKPIQALNQETP
jgi:predicted transcriptional regulator